MRIAVLTIAALGILGAPAAPQETSDRDPVASLIDRHIEARWKDLGITPAPAASDPVYLRRLALDLLGRLPTAQELDAFTADRTPDKRARLVDAWLASDEAAEYFTDRWIRILFNYRFEQADPLKVDFPAFAGFLKRAYADDLPWDRFATALVASRGEKDEKPEMNFLLKHLVPKEPPVELAIRTARVFLGVQIQCAQCHDHPTERYTQEDFWGLTAFYGGIKTKTRQTFEGVRTKVMQESAVVAMPAPDGRDLPVKPRFLDGREPGADEAPGAALARFIVDAADDRFAKAAVNRLWAHFMGRGFVDPVDRFTDREKASHPALLAGLAEDFRKGGFRPRRLMRGIALSRAYGLASARVKDAPEDAFAFKLLKPQDPAQFLNNLVRLLKLDVFLQEFYKQFVEGVKALPNYGNERVFRMYLFTFAQQILAPSGRAPEETPYAGSVRLALKMMNGTDLQGLVKAEWGLLAEILKERKEPADRLGRIFLTLLSRRPDGPEMERYLGYIARNKNKPAAYEDVFWTLLNSAEFFFNH